MVLNLASQTVAIGGIATAQWLPMDNDSVAGSMTIDFESWGPPKDIPPIDIFVKVNSTEQSLIAEIDI
jgi:hypothetical protein